MLLTLRFSEIGAADLYTHLLYPCGRLQILVSGELKHSHVGIVGHLNAKQLEMMRRLRRQAERESPKLKIYGPDWY